MRTKLASLVVLLGTLVGVAGGTALAARQIPHATGADDVILRIEHEKNGWGGEYRDAYDVTAYGDGRIVIVPPSTAAAPPLPGATGLYVSEAGVQRLLRAARAAGLLRATDYGDAGVTDQGTSHIEATTAGRTQRTDVYALLLREGDRGLTRAQRVHRSRLRAFVHDAADPAFYDDTVIMT